MDGAIRFVRALAISLFFFTYSLAASYSASVHLTDDYFVIPIDINADGRDDRLRQSLTPGRDSTVSLGNGSDVSLLPLQTLEAIDPALDWDREHSLLHAGDFNGDGRDDLYLQGRAAGSPQAFVLADETGRYLAVHEQFSGPQYGFDWSAAKQDVVVGDYDGNGQAELLLRGHDPFDIHLIMRPNRDGLLNTTGPSWVDGHLDLPWHSAAAELHPGDFNGDGRTDLLWRRKRHPGSAEETPLVALLLADGKGEFSEVAQAWDESFLDAEWDPGTHDIHIADITGDGIADIVLYARAADGTHYLVPGSMHGQFTEVALRWQGDKSAEEAWAAQASGTANIVFSNSAATSGKPDATTASTTTMFSTTTTSGGTDLTDDAVIVAGKLPGEAGTSGGSASYSIPVDMPPGRNGMQPSVSLNYSSRGGNGDAGMGWSLSAGSSIHRCPRMKAAGDVANLGVRYTVQDALCLDGKRLKLTSGTHGVAGAEYRTEIESHVRVVITEGNIGGSMSAKFRVDYSDGSKAYYGAGSNGAAATETEVVPANAPYPLSWLIGRREDAIGNSVIYRYNRHGAGENRLSEILYTNTGTSIEAGTRKVKFVWENRADTSSSYLAGGRSDVTMRLDRVDTYVGTVKVREYRLGYAASNAATGRAMLEAVTACAFKDGNTYCLTPTSFKWTNEQTGSNSPKGFKPRQEETISGWTESGRDTNTSMSPFARLSAVTDLDGNGTRELTIVDPGAPEGSRYLMWTGDELVNLESLLIGLPAASDKPVDLNNDGATDILSHESDQGLYISFKTGPGWTNADFSDSYPLGLSSVNAQSVLSSDFDADGDTDILVIHRADDVDRRTAKVIRNSHVAGNGVPQFHSSATTVAELSYLDGYQYGLPKRHHEEVEASIDLNGDGLPDLVTNFPHPNSQEQREFKRVLMAQMDATGDLNYVSLNAQQIHVPELDDGTYYRFIDVNGDGLQDLLYILPSTASANETPTWHVRLNVGAKVDPVSTPLFGPAFDTGISDRTECVTTDSCEYVRTPKYAKAFFNVDLDGDGREELLMPGDRLSTYCGKYDMPPSGSNTTEDPTAGEYYCGDALYHYGLGQYDRSVHRFKVLKIDVSSGGAISASVQATDVIAAVNAEVGDLNGDGRTDVWSLPALPGDDFKYLLSTDYDKDLLWNQHIQCPEECQDPSLGLYIQYGKSTPPDFVTGVTNGHGMKTEWEYAPLSKNPGGRDFYHAPPVGHSDRGGDDKHYYFTSTMRVVAAMHVDHGAQHGASGSNRNTTRYWYREAMYNNQGRGFLGFRGIVEKSVSRGLRTETSYHQKFPLVSRPEKITTVRGGIVVDGAISGGTPVSEKTFTWTHASANTLFGDGKNECVLSTGSVSKRFDPDSGTLFRETEKTHTPEAGACRIGAGNSTSTVSGLYTATTATDYSYASIDAGGWWLDKLIDSDTVSTVSWDSAPAGVAQSYGNRSSTHYEYGHATLRVPTKETAGAHATTASATRDPALTVVRTYGYDTWGNRSSVTVDNDPGGPAIAARTTTTGFGSNGYFPVTTTNPLNQTATATFNAAIGKPELVTDVQGIPTTFGYDAMGRKVFEQTGNLPPVITEYRRCGAGCPAPARSIVETTQSGAPTQTVFHDAYGRTVQTVVDAHDGGSRIRTAAEYDWAGRVVRSYEPYTGSPTAWNQTHGYDVLDRPTSVTDAAGVNRVFAYNGNTTTISVTPGDSPAFTNVETRTPDGKLVRLVDAMNGVTEYRYDAQGNPVAIEGPGGALLTTTYNALGQKTAVNDPDMGQWQYAYDVLGNVVQITDANGNATNQTYDKLDRMTSRNDGEFVTTWHWNPNSVPCRASLGSVVKSELDAGGVVIGDVHSEAYGYDGLCREATRTETIDSVAHTTSTTYNALGQVETVSYPETVLLNNQPPELTSLSGDQAFVFGDENIFLHAVANDPDDGPDDFRVLWEQIDSNPPHPGMDPRAITQDFPPANPGIYQFRFTAGDGVSSVSATKNVEITPQPPGAASIALPVNADATGTTSHDGDFRLTWGLSPGVNVSYRIEMRNLDGANTWATFSGCDAQSLAARDCTITDHGDGDLEFRVLAEADGLVSAPSTSASVLVRRRPGDVASVTAPASNYTAQFDVKWQPAAKNKAADVVYKLYERPVGGSYSLYGDVPDGDRCADDPGTVCGRVEGRWDQQQLQYMTKACNAAMDTVCGTESAASGTVDVDGPPSAPEGVTVTAYDATNKIIIDWQEKSSATHGYEVEATNVAVGGVPVFDNPVILQPPQESGCEPTPIDDSGIPDTRTCEATVAEHANPADGTWYYRVQACRYIPGYGDVLCGEYSDPLSATLAATPAVPDAPVITGDGDDDDTLGISWSGVALASDYVVRVKRAADADWPGNGNGCDIDTSATSCDSLRDDGEWQYRLAACNNGKCSADGPVSRTVEVRIRPATPTNMTVPASTSNDSATISWNRGNPKPSEVRYQLQSNVNGEWTTHIDADYPNTGTTQVTVNDLVMGTHTFRVRACNTVITSRCSGWHTGAQTLSVWEGKPGAPQNVAATANSSDVFVDWDAPERFEAITDEANDSYTVTYDDDPGFATPGSVTLEPYCTNPDDPVEPCTTGDFDIASEWTHASPVQATWHYKVRACNEHGCSESGAVSASFVPTPGRPSSINYTSQDGNGAFTVSWSTAASNGATSVVYRLQQSKNNGSWSNVGSLMSSTSKVVSGLGSGDYRFRVKACNGSATSTCSSYRTGSTMEVRHAPGTPSSLSVPDPVPSGDSYTVSWGSSSGIVTRYQLQVNPNGIGWSTVYSGTSRSRSYTAGNVGNSRAYRVRACNDWNCSSFRGPATVNFSYPSGGGCTGLGCPQPNVTEPDPEAGGDDDGGGNTIAASPVDNPEAPGESRKPTVESVTGNGNGVVADARTAAAGRDASRVAATDSASRRVDFASRQGADVSRVRSLQAANDKLAITTSNAVSAERPPARAMPPMRPADFYNSLRVGKPVEGTATGGHRARNVKTGLATTLATSSLGTTLPGSNRLEVRYIYTATGHLQAVQNADDRTRDIWRADARNARGQVTTETFANGVFTGRGYQANTGRPVSILSTGPSSTTVQDWQFTWSNIGNATTRTDALADGGNGMTETFDYDTLNRLTASTLIYAGHNGTENTTYSAAGNLMSKGSWNYTYGDGTAGPHAVTSLTDGTTTKTLAYDANGNLVQRNADPQTWYANGLPKTLSGNGNASTFFYGVHGQRYKQVLDKSGTLAETTTYIGSLIETVDKVGEPTQHRHMIFADGAVVAQHTRKSDNTIQQRYLHRDHLGSIDAMTDDDGNFAAPRMSFGSWGNRRSAATPDTGLPPADLDLIRDESHRGYTGHEMLDDVGFVHMNGRAYDPEIGRFLSVDPLFAYPDNPQSLNPYSYVHNNPLSYTDPSGYATCTQNDSTSCLEDGVNEITDEDGNIIGEITVTPDEGPRGANGVFQDQCSSSGACGSMFSRAEGDNREDADNGAESDKNPQSKAPDSHGDPTSRSTGDTETPLDDLSPKDYDTFEKRSELYQRMQTQLDEAGIDTVWFRAAGDLNKFFADGEHLLMTAGEFMDNLGVHLFEENLQTFNSIMSGDTNLRGQALDNFLVQREQMFVQKYIQKTYGNSMPFSIKLPIATAFWWGRGAMPRVMSQGIDYVEKRNKQDFNFWDTWHRIELGQAMMSQYRHEQ